MGTFNGIKTSLPENNDWSDPLRDFVSLFDGTNVLTDTVILNPGVNGIGVQITGSLIVSSSAAPVSTEDGVLGEVRVGHSGSIFGLYICSGSGVWYSASLVLAT